MMKFAENIEGKGDNADYQHFLLFPNGFQKAVFLWVFITWDCMVKGLPSTFTNLTFGNYQGKIPFTSYANFRLFQFSSK